MSTTARNFVNIIASPVEAFKALKEKAPILPPLAVVLLSQCVAIIVYFQVVDFDWMLDAMVAQFSVGQPPEAEETMRRAFGAMGATGMMVSGVISILLMYPLFTALYAGYLTIVSSVTNTGIRFGQWFALQWWGAVPMVFAGLASVANILLASGGQIRQEQINPLTLNNLIFSLEPSSSYYSLASAVDLTMLWSMALSIIGFRVWTGKDYLTSALIVLAPVVLIFGGIALLVG